MAATDKPVLRAGVLLDVDGTLLDTNYLHTLAWSQAMRDASIEGVTMADAHQAVGIASEQLIEHLAAGASDRAGRKAIKAHAKRYAKLQKEVVAFERAAELVERCTTRAWRSCWPPAAGRATWTGCCRPSGSTRS